jgi:UDP-hydrolysing UDP-N-acetyl-D-glucosamine 2-epimerase
VTFHPATLEPGTVEQQVQDLLAAFDSIPEIGIVFTGTNADAEGRVIEQLITDYVAARPARCFYTPSLGTLRYMSAIKYAQAVVGNSSSGIIEAPSLGTPTLDIGSRQRGRVRADSVIHCQAERSDIRAGLRKVLSPDLKAKAASISNPYEQVGTSHRIAEILSAWDIKKGLMKTFHDLSNEVKSK